MFFSNLLKRYKTQELILLFFFIFLIVSTLNPYRLEYFVKFLILPISIVVLVFPTLLKEWIVWLLTSVFLVLETESNFRDHGFDQVCYLVSANPGQPLKPLTKVASGGELSRISLAIQVILSESSKIPTLIFDEVDSGIGGGIAEIVGSKLRELGANRQIFCVTHLAQVASQAHQHYRVEKNKSEGNTTTAVTALSESERLEEVARMLGGITITEQTRAHASEMIAGPHRA